MLLASVRYLTYNRLAYLIMILSFTFYLVDFIRVLGSSRGQQIYTNGRARFVCSFKSYKVLKVIWNKEDNDTFPEKSRVKVLTTPIFLKKSKSIIVSLSLLHVISF